MRSFQYYLDKMDVRKISKDLELAKSLKKDLLILIRIPKKKLRNFAKKLKLIKNLFYIVNIDEKIHYLGMVQNHSVLRWVN